MASETRWRQAEVYARKVRLELFGEREPPFKHLRDAVRWIREEYESGRTEEYIAQSGALRAVFDRLHGQLCEAWDVELPGLEAHMSLRIVIVSFLGKDNWQEAVPATTDRLVRIAEETCYIGQFLGLPEMLATVFLLTGERRNITMTVSQAVMPGYNPVGIIAGSHTIEVDAERGADPDEIADAWRDGIPPRLSPLEQAIVDLVEEARADGLHPPKSTGKQGADVGLVKYWEALLQRWKNDPDRYPLYPYRSWDGLRGRYEKIQTREGASKHGTAR